MKKPNRPKLRLDRPRMTKPILSDERDLIPSSPSDNILPSHHLLTTDLPEPSAKRNTSILDTILNSARSLDLEGLSNEEGEPVGKGTLLDTDLPTFDKRYQKGKDKELTDKFASMTEQALANLKTKKSDQRSMLLAIRKQYQKDHGGSDKLTQSQLDLIDSICILALIETLTLSAAMKFGAIKLNRSSGKVSLQPILEKNLVPISAAKRLTIKTLHEISQQTGVRRATFEFGDDLSDEDLQGKIKEMDLILYGQPVPMRMKKVTLEEKVTKISGGDSDG